MAGCSGDPGGRGTGLRKLDDPILRPACKGVSVSLMAEAPQVKAGDRPQFSVAVSNNTNRPVRLLDVREGRRVDLQDTYFELFVIQQARSPSTSPLRSPIPAHCRRPISLTFDQAHGWSFAASATRWRSRNSGQAYMTRSFCSGAIPWNRTRHVAAQRRRDSPSKSDRRLTSRCTRRRSHGFLARLAPGNAAPRVSADR